jgi:hypothetical protein
MSNILGAAEGQVWPGMLAAGRRFAVIGALAAVASWASFAGGSPGTSSGLLHA